MVAWQLLRIIGSIIFTVNYTFYVEQKSPKYMICNVEYIYSHIQIVRLDSDKVDECNQGSVGQDRQASDPRCKCIPPKTFWRSWIVIFLIDCATDSCCRLPLDELLLHIWIAADMCVRCVLKSSAGDKWQVKGEPALIHSGGNLQFLRSWASTSSSRLIADHFKML